MKFLYQLIDHETGSRSKPFMGDWDEMAQAFKEHKEKIDSEDYILLVATINEDSPEEQMQIPTAPIITVQTFLDMYAAKPQKETANG